MGAYRIDKDLTITRVAGVPTEIIGDYQEWDCVSYDDDNDVWCNDRGLFEDDLVVAWIGEARRVPLPANGARLRGITYLVPAGTGPEMWRSLLTGKYGPPARDTDEVDMEGLHAGWCGQAACLGKGGLFRLHANVDLRGGHIALSQPDGTAGKVTALIEQEALRRAPRGVPNP